MTRKMFDSLDSKMFNEVASKRIAHVAANKKLDNLLDLCPCNHNCTCELAQPIKDAKKELAVSYNDLSNAEAAYSSYLKL